MKKVLTIAGSDSSGGAGIQADLKTFTMYGVYGMSVITALTAQNTCGVYDVLDIPSDMVKKQIDAVFLDIFPDAVKIGMVSSKDTILAIVEKLSSYKPQNIVVDPVMVSTSGHKLLSDSAMETLVNDLMPLADIITPNIIEAECLCGFEIKTEKDMIKSANFLGEKYRGSILIKGGHLNDSCNDLLNYRGKLIWYKGERINTHNSHGTGCTLSAAIATNLSKGMDIEVAVQNGKKYITQALSAGLDLGKGNGPINHCWQLTTGY